LTISYIPDVFGGTRRQVEASSAQAEAQRFVLEATYLTLTSNIALAAIQEASLRDQIEVTNDVVKKEVGIQIILKRYFDREEEYLKGQCNCKDVKTKHISLSDLTGQRAGIEQARQSLWPLEKQLAVQRDLLIALSGHLAGEGLPERFTFSSMQLPRDLPVSIPSQLVEQRPDVRAAEANLHAAAALIGVAIANRLPLFNLTGNIGRSGSQIGNLFNASPQFLFWTIAGSVTQTIFDGFTLEQRQRAAEAGWDQAAAQYRSTVVTAFQNVADVLQALDEDRRSLRAAIIAERAASENYTELYTEYKSQEDPPDFGSSETINGAAVLTAQQLLLATVLTVVQARASVFADTVALFQALGGGWWNRSDVEAP
jgi:NodT family efflux transporter outer membrane factor (OMF) lipoprotein